jgi:hypothetical protein
VKHCLILSPVLVVLVACLSGVENPAPTQSGRIPVSAAVTAAPALTPALAPTPTSTATPTPIPTTTATPTRLPTVPPSPTTTRPEVEPSPPPVTSSVTVVRGPYLQSVTQDSVVVLWDTDVPSVGGVAFWEDGLPVSRVVDLTVAARHVVTLTGLSSYTGYHYQVEADGVSLARPSTFRTAPGPDQSDFNFVAFGDTRTQHAVHERVVDRIQQLAPDFVLHTGDLVATGGDLEEWATFFGIEEPLISHAPLFPTLGNHEDDSVNYFDLFHLPGNERWYAFDYGNARFICLQVDGIVWFGPDGEQYAWLEEMLASNSQPWLIVYFHIPPYSALQEDDMEIKVRQALSPLFERYGVDIVFNGHHHGYQRGVVGGVTYVVTAGGGAPLYEVTQPDEHMVVYRNSHNVVYVEVRGQMLTATAITPEGEELDRFVLMVPE